MSSWRASVISRTTPLYCRITFAVSNCATLVWATARALLFAPPYAATSLHAAAHSGLESNGGGAGRNWPALFRMNGCTLPTHGVCAAANGGVRRQMPGPGLSVGKIDVIKIGSVSASRLRPRITWLAATTPILFPACLAGPSGIADSAAAYSGSRLLSEAGKNCMSVPFAAATTGDPGQSFLDARNAGSSG